MLLGGDADGQILLAFDLPEGEIIGAVLTLVPAARANLPGTQTLRTFRTTSFEGATLSRRLPARRVGRFGRSREIRGITGRPLRIDVTDLVRQGHDRVHLGIAASGRGLAWRIASPLAEDEGRHPYLDLRIRSLRP